jgi:hypothetical protein
MLADMEASILLVPTTGRSHPGDVVTAPYLPDPYLIEQASPFVGVTNNEKSAFPPRLPSSGGAECLFTP